MLALRLSVIATLLIFSTVGAAAGDSPGAGSPERPASQKAAATPRTDLSFCQPPFIHPLIINDLLAWLSDHGDQVVAINLTESNGSNRYSGEIKTAASELAPKHPLVSATTQDGGETIRYEYVGMTTSGVHVLSTWVFGSGTMVAGSLLLVTLEEDHGILQVPEAEEGGVGNRDGKLRFSRPRLLIRKVGELALGDRWNGELRVEGNKILVGHDQGFFSRGENGENSSPYNRKDIVLELEDTATRPGILKTCP